MTIIIDDCGSCGHHFDSADSFDDSLRLVVLGCTVCAECPECGAKVELETA